MEGKWGRTASVYNKAKCDEGADTHAQKEQQEWMHVTLAPAEGEKWICGSKKEKRQQECSHTHTQRRRRKASRMRMRVGVGAHCYTREAGTAPTEEKKRQCR
jgi:hypothetical protein